MSHVKMKLAYVILNNAVKYNDETVTYTSDIPNQVETTTLNVHAPAQNDLAVSHNNNRRRYK